MDQCSCRNVPVITGIIACLLLAGIPAAMADGTTSSAGGTVSVVSYPPGAAVDLNGVYSGVTPVRLEKVPPGEYLVGVSLAGYKNETIPITIYDGSTREIGVNLENLALSTISTEGYGSVAVDSTPGGALVTLDGSAAGTTPAGHAALILNAVRAGNHTVTVELAGYPRYTSTVTVIKNKVVRVNADLVTETSATSDTPAVPGTTAGPAPPSATTGSRPPLPLSPLTAVTAAGLAALAAVFFRP
jgi:hypothetical protein